MKTNHIFLADDIKLDNNMYSIIMNKHNNDVEIYPYYTDY